MHVRHVRDYTLMLHAASFQTSQWMISAITFCDVTIKNGVLSVGSLYRGAMESVAVYHEQRYVVGRYCW